MPAAKDATVSIQLVWPIARAAGSRCIRKLLRRAGLTPSDYANRHTRIAYGALVDWLADLVESRDDPLLGLRAGTLIQPGDFATLERALCASATLSEALEMYSRYAPLTNEAADVSIEAKNGAHVLRYRVTAGTEPPAATDYFIASLVTFLRRETYRSDLPHEVHFVHAAPRDLEAYEQFFRCRLVFDAPANAIVLSRGQSEIAMRSSDPLTRHTFEIRAKATLDYLAQSQTVAARVRDLVQSTLRLSQVLLEMAVVARKLAMSVATLRRRLSDEGSQFHDIVDDVRRELAVEYLRDTDLAPTKVARLLGFDEAASFRRAFRRWQGTTITEFRSGTRPGSARSSV